MAQDDGLRSVRPILVARERPPDEDRHAEQLEEVGGYAAGSQLFRERSAGVVHNPRVEGGDVAEHVRLLAEVLKLRRRRPRERAVGHGRLDHHQAIGIGKRYRPEENGVDDGEDGGVRADAERERGDGGSREAAALPEHSQRLLQVLEEGVHLASLDDWDESSISA